MKTLVEYLVAIGISCTLMEVFWRIYDKYDEKLFKEYMKGYMAASNEHECEHNWEKAYLEGSLKWLKKDLMGEEA